MTRIDFPQQQPGITRPSVALTVDMGDVGNAEWEVAAVRQLVQLVGEHHLDTTWVVDHACQLSWVATLQNSSTRHELALNTTWAMPGLSASQFQRQLRERWELCEQVDVVPTAVYSPKPEPLRQRLNHLIRYGLTTCVIGHPTDVKLDRTQSGWPDCYPHPLPLGLWQLPITMRLPCERSWLRFTPARRLPGAGRSRSSGAGMHVLIVAEQVVARGSSGLREIDHFLRKVAWASSADQLEVITAAQWTSKMAHRAVATPQRSILHIAA